MATPPRLDDDASTTVQRRRCGLPASTGTERPQPLLSVRPRRCFTRQTAGAGDANWSLNGWRLLLTVPCCCAAWEVAATTVTTPFWISQPTRVFDRLVTPDDERPAVLARRGDAPGGAAGAGARRVVGVALGLLLGAHPRVADVVDPLPDGPEQPAAVALAPLFIIWFGIGLPSKVILAFSLVVFPVLINAYQGVRGVTRAWWTCCERCRPRRWQIARRVTIPSTLPWIIAGLGSASG